MYLLDDYHYDLPESLIAQRPMEKRESSRLLHLERDSGAISHHRFHDVTALLAPGDILVVNNTKVIPGRLPGRKRSGGRIEALILDYAAAGPGSSCAGKYERTFRCLVKSSKRLRPGSWVDFSPELSAEVLACEQGLASLRFVGLQPFETLLEKIGKVPLPPYIKRDPNQDHQQAEDRRSYQTVYAAQPGAIAAPTAGLHFSQAILDDLAQKGIEVLTITLHVGYGTFLPVRVEDIRDHKMHAESYTISAETAVRLNAAKDNGRRIIAVGTTSVRALEYHSDPAGRLSPGGATCDLFIYPGYRFKLIDGLITNFHLPCSTLLMLVSALAGRESILAAYRAAVESKYRFFSYGDAMLIV